MSLVELISFLISLLAILFLFFKKQREDTDQQLHDEDNEEEPLEDELLKNYSSFEKRAPEKIFSRKTAPPPLPSAKPEAVSPHLAAHRSKSSIEAHRLRSSLEDYQIATPLTHKEKGLASHQTMIHKAKDHEEREMKGQPRVAALVKQLPHLKNMVIYQEIIGKPKGLID